MEHNMKVSGVKIVIYKEILKGDFRKFRAESNDSHTGGGARDLRFNPGEIFEPIFLRMFDLDQSNGIMTGEFHWNGIASTTAEVYPPTTARPGEIRLSKVHQCFPESIIPNDSKDNILLIILNSNNEVWPCFTTRQSLRDDDWHPFIREAILAGLGASRKKGVAANGFIDFEKGGSFTNGK